MNSINGIKSSELGLKNESKYYSLLRRCNWCACFMYEVLLILPYRCAVAASQHADQSGVLLQARNKTRFSI